MNHDNSDITLLLIKVNKGDEAAMEQLLPIVYEKLLVIARHQLKREYDDHTLNKADLVHEVFLKLVEKTGIYWQNRSHFFAIAAKAMRQILTDYARKKLAKKRGSKQQHLTLNEEAINLNTQANELIMIDEALNDLFMMSERLAKVVELRFYAGLSLEETGQAIGVSEKTVRRDWAKARAWLFKRLKSTG